MTKTAFIKSPLLISFLLANLFIITTNVHAQAEFSENDPVQFDLTLKVTNLKFYKGKVYAQLFDEKGTIIKNMVSVIEKEEDPLLIISQLPIGSYAVRVFHDQNSNGKLDTNLVGIPKERFGFSNNVMGKFGPPAFEEQLFKHDSVSELQINLVGK